MSAPSGSGSLYFIKIRAFDCLGLRFFPLGPQAVFVIFPAFACLSACCGQMFSRKKHFSRFKD